MLDSPAGHWMHQQTQKVIKRHKEFILVTSVIYLADSERGTLNSFSCWSAMRLSEAILGFIDFTRVISGRCYNLISYQDIGETKRMLSEDYIMANMDLQFICLYKGQDDCSFTWKWTKHWPGLKIFFSPQLFFLCINMFCKTCVFFVFF